MASSTRNVFTCRERVQPTAPLLSWAPSAPSSWLLPRSPASRGPIHVHLPRSLCGPPSRLPSLSTFLFLFLPQRPRQPLPHPSCSYTFAHSPFLCLPALALFPSLSLSRLCLSLTLCHQFALSRCVSVSPPSLHLSPCPSCFYLLLSPSVSVSHLPRNETLSPGGRAREPQPGPFSPTPCPHSHPSPEKGIRSQVGLSGAPGVGDTLGKAEARSWVSAAGPVILPATHVAPTRCGAICPGKCLRCEWGCADLGEVGKEEMGWGLSSGQS